MVEMICGDCIETIRRLEPDTFDALITDPPYSSGGMFRGDRTRPTSEKYLTGKKTDYVRHDFSGDNMDQRVWMRYTTEWMSLARCAVRMGGVCAVFIDWRQLPALTDAMQMAGWIYRGVAVWDKVNARPQLGRFRQQCEFIAWGSKEPLATNRDAPVLQGCISCPAPSVTKRLHQTEKPVELMRTVVKLCQRGGKILDPFAGSGSTLVAAELEGFSALGVETDEYFVEVARQRLGQVEIQPNTRGWER